MIDMILNQRSLGLAHRFLDRVQLLGDIHTLAPFFDHGDDAAQMAVGPFQALDNSYVGLVRMAVGVVVFTHGSSSSLGDSDRHSIPPGGIQSKPMRYTFTKALFCAGRFPENLLDDWSVYV
ncbi:hypothetical protein ALQ91_102155 [Pseudomonas syringae pv. syringae]|nr:hypothetical protein ALQ91_102155 [Pseudomonas syringae pv. syringae]